MRLRSNPGRGSVSLLVAGIAWKFLLAALASTALAQQQPQELSLRSLPKRFVQDEAALWTSPFRQSVSRGPFLKKYVLPFTALTAVLIGSDRKIADSLPNTSHQTRWSGRISQLGASYSLAGLSAGTYVFGALGGNERARETGLLALEALGHTEVGVFAIKQLTNRERPLQADGARRGFWNGGNSFPSGHAGGAFAVATVFACEYRDHLAVPIAGYSIATAISVSRVGARRHWASDIVAGGALGIMIGRFTCGHRQGRSRLLPKVGLGPSGPALSWRL